MTAADLIAGLCLVVWGYLILGHGGFWRGRQHEDFELPPVRDVAAPWPRVTAIIPARNEADQLPQSLSSLIAQDYPGAFNIILVDDQSTDGTADVAKGLAGVAGRSVQVVRGARLPAAWTGKVWAMHQGIAIANKGPDTPDYLLLTDADIGYAPDALRHIVSRAEAGPLVLTSLMAKLRCESTAERMLIPAFIFFFQMLYPFAWVNRRRTRTAAAAGGCMLIERDALARIGGIAAIRGALIDDCSLARHMKGQGLIWLGLSAHVVSLRAYPHFTDIRRMVARSAYAQLKYSPMLLAGTVIGMALVYLAAPMLAIFGGTPANLIALAAYALMIMSLQPTLRFYGLSPLWGAALPAIATVYLAFTLDSAYQQARGRGGMWKGRSQALPLAGTDQ